MKRLLFPLLLAACSVDPMDIPEVVTSDAGVQAIQQPLTIDTELAVVYRINYTNWFDAGLSKSILPLSNWICPPYAVALRAEADPGQRNEDTAWYGEAILSGASAIHIEPYTDCGGGGSVKTCEYRFPAISVSSQKRVAIYLVQMKPCGHGSPYESEPRRAVSVHPGFGLPIQTAGVDTSGFYNNKAFWRSVICESGCYACGAEWWSNNTMLNRRVCTFNPRAGACLEPCHMEYATW